MADEFQVIDLFFDYELPQHLIAQEPSAVRDAARLLVVGHDGSLAHRRFHDLPSLLLPGDLLVLNDTKVLPARVIGKRAATGGKWEGLFLRTTDDGVWEMLAQTRGFPNSGDEFITDSGLTLTLVGRTSDRHWLMRPAVPGTPAEVLSLHGQMPLPPYIRKGRANDADAERYQTVYASVAGSVAAPTAGLHFTPAMLSALETHGVSIARVTLHVGLGTFLPVTADDPTTHAIHAEWCEVTAATSERIRTTKTNGGRIIAVGTTTARTLETAGLEPYCGETAKFIHPPYQFRVVDGLVTNFHLPRTTLLLLVQALCGSNVLRKAYAVAIAEGYRFYSYGDAMVVLPG